jgi:pimeloyl-ACP methyl ester carboxylesterase
MSRRTGRRSVQVLWIAALVGSLVGCSLGGGTDRPKSGASSAAATAPAPTSGSLHWKSCDGAFECASLRVPLDYTRPNGRQLTLALARRPATGKRIGSLVVNPGGPGGSGIDLAESKRFPDGVEQHFDVVGFDPRGVGRSTSISCHSHLQAMYDADPTPTTAADRAAYLRVSRAYVDECARKAASLLPHLGTLDVARDLDRIRVALGEGKLNYLGYSYGTSIGEMYAQLFPTRIRTMVLDGVVDTEQTGLQAADEQAGGFEQALKAYLADCGGQASCALGPSPDAALARLVAMAEQRPIPAKGADRPATPGIVQLAIGVALYSKASWPVLSDAVQRGLGGDGTELVQLADSYLGRKQDGSYGNSFDIYFAVSCLDNAWPHDPAAVFRNAKAAGRDYPLIGEGLVNDYVRCALWPVRPQPLPKLTAPGSPPILVISTTRDPATPYQSGVTVARRLPKGVLLTNDGDGHTVFGQGKACVDDAVTRYLVEAKAPAGGLRCA